MSKIFFNKNNLLSLILLLAIVLSVIQIVKSATPDPGHSWSEIDDTPLPANRGGTGQTSLTANSVILGNDTNPVQFVAPGTAGNVLMSNGTTWQSNTLTPNIFLLYNSESDSTEYNNTTAETNLKSWTLNVAPSSYTYYILEAEVTANDARNANSNATFTWKFKEGSNIKKTITWRTISITAIANTNTGIRYAATIRTLFSNSGLPTNANFILSGTMSVANTSLTMMAHSFRVYGVK